MTGCHTWSINAYGEAMLRMSMGKFVSTIFQRVQNADKWHKLCLIDNTLDGFDALQSNHVHKHSSEVILVIKLRCLLHNIIGDELKVFSMRE